MGWDNIITNRVDIYNLFCVINYYKTGFYYKTGCNKALIFFTDDSIMTQNLQFTPGRTESTLEKGENAGFQKTSTTESLILYHTIMTFNNPVYVAC